MNPLFFTEPKEENKYRIFFFSYAGSGASIGLPYHRLLQPEIDLISIQLPGRENRIDEQPYDNIPSMIEPLLLAFIPYLDRPFYLWGHCSGALIAYELLLKLQRFGSDANGFFVSACAAPTLANSILPVSFHQLSDEDFIEAIENLMKDSFTITHENSDTIKILLPTIRADFGSYEQYQPTADISLNCPIYAFSATQDQLVSHEAMSRWQHHTTQSFYLDEIPDEKHYFINHRFEELSKKIKKIVLNT